MSLKKEDTVQGTFHQGDTSHFNENTAGRQCMANAVAGAVYATMLPINFWTSSALDRILVEGDNLYSRRCNSHYDYLQFSDIHQTEHLFHEQYVINGGEPMTGLIATTRPQTPPFFSLRQAICTMEVCERWTYGVLTIAEETAGVSVLLCIRQGNYYIFDSHSRNRCGNSVPNGTSVLLHFTTQIGLIKYIRTIANELFATQFEITVLSPVSLGHYNMMRTEENSQDSQRQQNLRSKSQKEKNSQNNQENVQNERKTTSKSQIRSKMSSEKEQNSQNSKQNLQNERKTRSRTQIRSQMSSNKDCNSECGKKFKKLHQKRKDDKQEKKNSNEKYYENKKRKVTEINNIKCDTTTKKTKSAQLEKETVSSNVPKRYNTRSKKSHTDHEVQISDLNSLESNKRKRNDENFNLSKTNNNLSKKRRITKKNSQEEQMENSQNDDIHEYTNISQEENTQNETLNIDECLRLFNINISNGPVYVCTVCLQTWFRRSVCDMQLIKISSQIEEEKLNQCRRYYVSAENKEWICKGCQDSIKIGKIPKLSIENKMGFPEQPTELNLNGMEERLTSPRLTLFQMRDLPCGAQKSVRGNSVNLPIDIAPTVDMLPRTLDNSETIAINFKRRMCYKGCAFKKENIRPAAVWKAVNYLMMHSQMYKDLDIQLDTSWITNIQNPNDTCQCNEQNVYNNSQPTNILSNNEEENNENIDNIDRRR